MGHKKFLFIYINRQFSDQANLGKPGFGTDPGFSGERPSSTLTTEEPPEVILQVVVITFYYNTDFH